MNLGVTLLPDISQDFSFLFGAHPHPPTAPHQSRNMVISHCCCIKLVFLCGCDRHMVFGEERSLRKIESLFEKKGKYVHKTNAFTFIHVI